MPATQLGGAGGQIRTGRGRVCLDQPSRKMCSLDLAMLDTCGIHLRQFGDASEQLAEV